MNFDKCDLNWYGGDSRVTDVSGKLSVSGGVIVQSCFEHESEYMEIAVLCKQCVRVKRIFIHVKFFALRSASEGHSDRTEVKRIVPRRDTRIQMSGDIFQRLQEIVGTRIGGTGNCAAHQSSCDAE